jgi:MFS-type transporter involved in bile tolerance (Atg22 family)
MIRPLTVETVCFEILFVSVLTALAAWIWGMLRRSFGSVPALLWIVLSCVSLICAAVIGIIEFTR